MISVMINESVKCPTLSLHDIAALSVRGIKSITRHFEAQYLPSVKKGYFRFGTIAGYAPQDNALNAGRFGDHQEGNQREIYRPLQRVTKNIDMGNVKIGALESDAPIVIEYTVNDYCSCSSKGDFDLSRAIRLRAQGNPTLDSYVTYDLMKLRVALEKAANAIDHLKGYKLVGRPIVYGLKDRSWGLENDFKREEDRDQLSIWLATAFVKSPAYQHEDEYRLLLIDPTRAGQQCLTAPPISFVDARIAEAIIAVGEF